VVSDSSQRARDDGRLVALAGRACGCPGQRDENRSPAAAHAYDSSTYVSSHRHPARAFDRENEVRTYLDGEALSLRAGLFGWLYYGAFLASTSSLDREERGHVHLGASSGRRHTAPGLRRLTTESSRAGLRFRPPLCATSALCRSNPTPTSPPVRRRLRRPIRRCRGRALDR
jgi:hypothetical protein